MRLNRGTVVLIVVLVVVFAAVLFVNNQQTSAPVATNTPLPASGQLLPGVASETVVRYEVRDNTSGQFVALTKDAGGAWHIDATNALEGRAPEQSLINSTVGQLTSINFNNTFDDDQLTTFGLDHPAYTVQVTTSDNQFYTIYVGAKSPTSARYYTVVQQTAAPESTAEPMTDATSEATAEVASKQVAPPARIAQASTEEPTAEATAAVTAEATANVIQNPGITLEGTQTIYLIPQTVIDTLKGWLTNPPYAPLPTATPTNEGGSLLPIPEIGATTAPAEATTAPTTVPTVEATEAATAEATAGS